MHALLIPGIILGVFAGWAWHRSDRTWKDWQRAKASARALRWLTLKHGFYGLLWVVVVVYAVTRH